MCAKMNTFQLSKCCDRAFSLRLCFGLLATVHLLSVASAEDPKTDVGRVYSEASLVWAKQLSRFLSEPSERHVSIAEDGMTRQVIWLNYTNPQRRLIQSTSDSAVHVYAVNGKYSFDITDVRSQGRFQLNVLGPTADDTVITGSYESFFPEGTIVFYPVIALTRRDLVTISSIEKDPVSSEYIWITGTVLQTTESKEEPLSLFGNHWQAGTVLRACVNPSNEWKVVRSELEYPGGMRWTQVNTVTASDGIHSEVTGHFGGETVREYSFDWKEAALRPREDAVFFLPHYGLSESTAGYLMGSRRYILVFCGLFFGAIFFQILASVLKRRQAKDG